MILGGTRSDVADRLRRLVLHRRTQMAVKAALAAALSWVAAELITRYLATDLENYTYYAPLGAVVATYPTLASSVRTAGRAGLALALGGTLGLVVHETLHPSVLSLALVVGVGVVLGALPGLGEERSWVPIVALFVLVIGGGDAQDYATAYVGLTALGALCGVAVSLLLPALRLTQGRDAVRFLQELLAGQLEDLAGGLRQDRPPGEREWQGRMRAVDPALQALREAMAEVSDARRGNPRARFHIREVRRQEDVARVLERVTVLVEDLVAMIAESYREDLPSTPLDSELAGITARALECLAELVRAYEPDLTADDDRVDAVRQAMERLSDAFARRRDLDPSDVAVLGAVVWNLRRSVAAVEPR